MPTTIRGRITVDGQPVPFCKVRLFYFGAQQQVQAQPQGARSGSTPVTVAVSETPAGRPDPVFTGADGRFELQTDRNPATDRLAIYYYLDAAGAPTDAGAVVYSTDGANRVPWSIRWPAAPAFLTAAQAANAAIVPAHLPGQGTRQAEPTRDGTPVPALTAYADDAVRAFWTVVKARLWYDRQRAAASSLPAVARVTVVHPHKANAEYYHSGTREIRLNGRDAGPSVVAHEFGHHVFYAGAPGYDLPGGGHQISGYSEGAQLEYMSAIYPGAGDSFSEAQLDDALDFQRALDFSEGYASFFGQNALGAALFRNPDPRNPVRWNAESPDRPDQWGDGPTLSYLWDLTDPAGGGEAWDTFQRPWHEIHAHFVRWSATLPRSTSTGNWTQPPASRRKLRGFHAYLKTQYAAQAAVLDEIARRNHLAEAVGIPATAAAPPPAARPAAAHR